MAVSGCSIYALNFVLPSHFLPTLWHAQDLLDASLFQTLALVDYVIVRSRDLNEVQITPAMHGAGCSTDHRFHFRSTLRLSVRPTARRQKPMHALNVHAAHNQNISEELRNAIAQFFSHISTTTTLNCTPILTMEWQALSLTILIASKSTLGNMETRHQD